jgi:hypothetical protein
MQSAVAETSASLRGLQEPRISSWPAYTTSAAEEVIKVGELAGIYLDPWQKFQLRHGLGESPDWKCPLCTHRSVLGPLPCPDHPWADLIHPWSAFEVCSICTRQNGKSEILIVRMLGGLFVLEEPLQIFSAHQFDTALEVMLRLAAVIENTDDLRREVKHRGSRMVGIIWANGKEGITLGSGLRVRFKARTGGGGRGFSADTLYLDEAMILKESFVSTTMPVLSTRANPQIWLAGSAPDEDEPSHDGIVLAKRRQRALGGGDPSLAYFEHSAHVGPPEKDDPATIGREVLDDPRQWAMGNPGLGIRITGEYVGNERRGMSARGFAVERLGISKWPDVDEDADRKIPRAAWDACREEAVTVEPSEIKPVCLAIDVSPNRASAAIGACGRRADGKWVGVVLKHGPGVEWVVPELADIAKGCRPIKVVWDKKSQANELADAMKKARIRNLKPIDTGELVEACGRLYDSIVQVDERGERKFVHIGQEMLDEAVAGAAERKLYNGDAWAWQRVTSTADITPLVAVTLARWGAESGRRGGAADTAGALERAQAEAAAMVAALNQ